MGTSIHKALKINRPTNSVLDVPLEFRDLRNDRNGLMQQGVAWYQANIQDLQRAKHSAAVSGAFFMLAKRCCMDGDWADVCRANAIIVTTANRYIEFAEYCIEQGRIDAPDQGDEMKLLQRGIEVAMSSPRAWTALMRYNGHLEKEGQYDPDRYRQQQAGFDYKPLRMAVVRAADYVARIPETAPVEELVPLRDQLSRALQSVENRIQQINGTVEVQ